MLEFNRALARRKQSRSEEERAQARATSGTRFGMAKSQDSSGAQRVGTWVAICGTGRRSLGARCTGTRLPELPKVSQLAQTRLSCASTPLERRRGPSEELPVGRLRRCDAAALAPRRELLLPFGVAGVACNACRTCARRRASLTAQPSQRVAGLTMTEL